MSYLFSRRLHTRTSYNTRTKGRCAVLECGEMARRSLKRKIGTTHSTTERVRGDRALCSRTKGRGCGVALSSIVRIHQAVPSSHCADLTRSTSLTAQWAGLKRGLVPCYPPMEYGAAPSRAILSSDRIARPRPWLSSNGIARPRAALPSDRIARPHSALSSDGIVWARPLLFSDRIAGPRPALSSDGIPRPRPTLSSPPTG